MQQRPGFKEVTDGVVQQALILNGGDLHAFGGRIARVPILRRKALEKRVRLACSASDVRSLLLRATSSAAAEELS
jgi:hypothetical protein